MKPEPRKWPSTGSSNGHEWFKPDWLFVEACRICGIVRRADDASKPCKGPVPINLRERQMQIVEPSDAERSAWPEATEHYVRAVENRNAELEAALWVALNGVEIIIEPGQARGCVETIHGPDGSVLVRRERLK